MNKCAICECALTDLSWDLEHPMFVCDSCHTVQRAVVDEGEYMDLYKSGRYYTDLQAAREGYDEHTRFDHDLKVNEVRVGNIKQVACVDRRHLERRGAEPGGASVLDVGCGNGALCRALLDGGFGSVIGVDPDPHVINFAIEKVPEASFHVGTMRDRQFNARFEVVTFMDSLEHDLDPIECLYRAGCVLTQDGRVIIETPDCECDDFKKFGSKWKHVKPTEHPFLFSLASIEVMFRKSGLKVADVRYTIPGRIMVAGERI